MILNVSFLYIFYFFIIFFFLFESVNKLKEKK